MLAPIATRYHEAPRSARQHTHSDLPSLANARQALLLEVTKDLNNVRVDFFKGLLVESAAEHGVTAIVKGLRAVSDFDYELQMAQMNYQLAKIDTLFMPTSPRWSFLSSSLVREVARFGGDVSKMVPPQVAERLQERLKK